MSAISSGNVETVRLIVDAGAELTTQTSWGETALSLAAVSGQEAIADLLLDAGAILPLNRAGRRATLQASKKGLVTLVSRLESFNGDYGAVADVGVQRERVVDGPQLAEIAELDESTNADPGSDSQQPSTQDDTVDVTIAMALEGIPYQRGFQRRYDHLEKIGKGHFAEVFSCRSKITGVRYAAKITLFTGSIKEFNKSSARAEIRALTELRHKNMTGLIDVVVTDDMNALCLVLELATGGDLFSLIVAKKKLTEDESRTIHCQMMSAVKYMHEEGWAHRDIKPENILLYGTNYIKLADFGLSIHLRSKEGEVDNELSGTPSYIAPEVLADGNDRRYSYPIDVWSAGVVLYICLCGFPPFSDELYSTEFPFTLSQQIKSGRFDYPSPYWDSVGDFALDLIESMLVVDPQGRFSAEDCMRHPWVITPELGGVTSPSRFSPRFSYAPVGVRSTEWGHGQAELKPTEEIWDE